VIYDLDVMARATADGLGLRMERVQTPGTDPRFVAMIRALVTERTDGSEPLVLGDMGVRRAPCAAGCCPAPSGPRPTTSAKMADGA
jgi:ferrochelatase